MTINERINQYLESGGLFNPEMMEPDKVRDLLMDCRDELTATANGDSTMLNWLEENKCGIVPCWKDDPDGVFTHAGWLVVAAEHSDKTYGIELVRPTVRDALRTALEMEKV